MALISMVLVLPITAVPVMRKTDHGNRFVVPDCDPPTPPPPASGLKPSMAGCGFGIGLEIASRFPLNTMFCFKVRFVPVTLK